LQLVGSHNAANAMAALALCEAAGIDLASVLPALVAFKGLAHRVEWVAEIDGVAYFDDSKGTNVGATLAALQGLGRPVAIILGGDGKGQDFAPLRSALDATCTRGSADRTRRGGDCRRSRGLPVCPLQPCVDMAEAVRWCAAQAQTRAMPCCLSPACASFDMYRNYAHRAEVIRRSVARVEREAA
jgi:UDP-N-acetylmuramoylalanine--D-glutamate ligase